MMNYMPGTIKFKNSMPISDSRIYRGTEADKQLLSRITGWTRQQINQIEKYGKKKSEASKVICSRRKSTVVITVILLCIIGPLAWLLGDFLADLYD
jgi:hypothetical protein